MDILLYITVDFRHMILIETTSAIKQAKQPYSLKIETET